MKRVSFILKHVSFLLIHVLFWSTALADEMKPSARTLENRGLRAYDVQQYDEASDHFRAAYQIDPRPELLYALGQSERMAGHYQRAIEAYRAFLRTNPASAQSGPARKNIVRCEQALAAVSQDRAPPPEPSPAPATPPQISTPPLTSPVLVERRRASQDTAGHVMLALGLAGLVTGGALVGVGQSAIDAANSAGQYDRFVMLHDAAGGAEGERIGGFVSLAIGGALVAAAVIHYAVWVKGR
jgi:tetratricopeptide (TPR) repeat protein